jgi:hypothetical protein
MWITLWVLKLYQSRARLGLQTKKDSDLLKSECTWVHKRPSTFYSTYVAMPVATSCKNPLHLSHFSFSHPLSSTLPTVQAIAHQSSAIGHGFQAMLLLSSATLLTRIHATHEGYASTISSLVPPSHPST